MSGPRGRRHAWIATAATGAFVAAAAMSPATAAPGAPTAAPAAAPVVAAVDPDAADGEYRERFLALYAKIKDPANGYFSPQGIPYHAVETLMVEAPDYGHETTSEAYSYWIWLEALYGQATEDWEPLNDAWDTLEQYMIPRREDQPTNSFYDPNSPATYAPEHNHPSSYPSQLSSGVDVGTDPLAAELRSTYGTPDVYQMHWLADVDNVYGYGNAPGAGCQLGPDYEGTSYINTFQRGPQESVWETIPQPTCDDFTYGGPNGYLDLFTGDAQYAQQWKYTSASDADARAIEAVYWANQWATEQGRQAEIAQTVEKASKLGDYLRYTLFDKYFKTIGCTSTSCAAGTGRQSAHYLLSWYMAWGGATNTNAGWAWRIGSSHAHFGYQNPFTAWVLSNDADMIPASPTAEADWANALDRQLELYTWLQSADGPIAGGATNSWNGQYAAPPSGTPTFYGMAYTEAPVYNDPPSNRWFGMQAWGVQRVAELYYETGDVRAQRILDKWVPWVVDHIEVDGDDWSVPSELNWSGAPDTWNAANPGSNANLRVSLRSSGQDVGVAGDTARALIFYAARSGDVEAQETAKALLDVIWENHQDDLGVSTVETRSDYQRFDDVYTSGGDGIYIPQGWRGTMPNGDVVEPGVSFLDIRSFYTDDPMWPEVEAALNGGDDPQFRYHRFWAQTAVAAALADYDRMFGGDEPQDPDTQAPTAPGRPTVSGITSTGATLTWAASSDDVGVTGYAVRDASGASLATATGTSVTLTGLSPDTAYTVTVVARDAAGNVSTASPSATFTTDEGQDPGDTTPPSAPGTPTASDVTTTSARISWGASTDDVGVTGYVVQSVGGATLATSTTTSVTLSGLAADSSYSVRVVARDAAGNTSAPSTTLTFRTSGGQQGGACTAALKVISSWPGGYQAEVAVTAGSAPINGWTTTLALPGGSVAHLWSGTVSGSGPYTVRNAPWNGSLGASATTSYGFIGSGTVPAPGPLTCTSP